jgi:CubicO group peptidase (beta-lactamase class C family)
MATTGEAIGGVFSRWARRTRAPGVAWGVVRWGELFASGGVGVVRLGDDSAPDANTAFRIASMTKSFTGAALMTLVAVGRLRLDDPVSTYLPQLAGWAFPSDDGPPITVRHLVSMEAGLPTDDAWADRHIDLSDDQMDALLEDGGAFAWTPGTRFEYSNLGWALVGRIVEGVAGVRVQDLVGSALLGPLGMSATTWERPRAGSVAEPYRERDGTWLHEGAPLGDGTIAPMGGIWSTVGDLARWVGFLLDAFPPRDGDDAGPLPRWARREMQQLRRVDELIRFRPSPAGPSRSSVTGYGIGLGIRIDERLGMAVGHSGGLPGYGSHMRWLPDRGVGVIGLSNVSYGNMHGACLEAFEVLADRDELGPDRTVRPDASLEAAAASSASLLNSWTDAATQGLFADNVALDESLERRAEEAAGLVARYGRLAVEELDAETPLRGSFTAGAGDVRVEIGLNHGRRVQWLDVEDRLRPSDAPIVVDDRLLADAAGSVFVVVRPVGRLAEAFTEWQDRALDRIGAPATIAPAAHATLASFGSRSDPVGSRDEARIVETVTAWAVERAPIDLRALRLGVLDGVPVVSLERTASFVEALQTLRAAAAGAALPRGSTDDIPTEAYAPHLSLAYVGELEADRRAELEAWMGGVSDEVAPSVALRAEVVGYDGGPERRLALCTFGRSGA